MRSSFPHAPFSFKPEWRRKEGNTKRITETEYSKEGALKRWYAQVRQYMSEHKDEQWPEQYDPKEVAREKKRLDERHRKRKEEEQNAMTLQVC